ncbi:hypothetical protein SAMN05216371_1341 [Streptomyces sp. TLI_053]|uniref:hypothetical protein n=1 Tax=Streptomyces sp. TLI_053 TaxID=1855352 RepID=UPI00087B7574|nr:hypothetical protein [Streptomyces sp. TLI_053]SDT12332.1 hypothetical protein SAMN05216371_1341 [Streptomyces sp. TLI_053]
MRTYPTAAVAVNLLLGLPAVVPVWLLWYFAVNWPLAELGWTRREPTENDGVLPWLMLAVPVLAVFAAVWWPANHLLRRRRRHRYADPGRAGAYWTTSALLTLVPTGVLIVVL